MFQQNFFVLWLTGLSAAGKTTIARTIYQQLKSKGHKTHHLDGDEVRDASQEKLGYSPADRDKNISLAIDLAKKYQNQGFIVAASFISPYKNIGNGGERS